MIDNNPNPDVAVTDKAPNVSEQNALKSDQPKFSMSKSMHDGVEVWCDCCSCEAEPYWLDAMESYQDTDKNNKS
jgi:hypothetical protein